MATGLGGEQLWLSPTVANNVNPYDDQSGQGNNGTNNGTTVVSDTSSGGTYAFDFDGVNDSITGSTLGSGTTDAICVAMWLNLDVWGITKYLFSLNGDGSSVANDSMGSYITAPNTLCAFTRPNYSIINYTYSSGAGNWFHLCFNREPSTGTIDYYINGVKVESATGNSDLASLANGYVLGGEASGNNQFKIDGKVDDFRVFKRSLTQAEITHLASQRGVEGPPPVGLGDEQLWLCPSINDSANDISGNGNDGTYNGGMGTIASTGSGGSRAYEINGNSRYIDCGNILDAPPEFTISLWFYRTTSDPGGLVSKINGTGGYMIFNGNIPTAASNGSPYAGGNPAPFNTWQHIAATYDGTDLKVYQGGVETASIADTAPLSTSANFLIGRYLTATCRGQYDDIRAYTRAITQAEITHLATSRGIEGSPGGATHYNPFKTHAFTNNFQQRLR